MEEFGVFGGCHPKRGDSVNTRANQWNDILRSDVAE